MAKKCVNGVYMEMTPDEIAEMERLAAEMPAPEPTPDERLKMVEDKLDILDIILGGGT